MVGLVVYVGMAKISLVIDQSHSLKEKRMVLRRIRDRVRERLHVTINEVGELDNWQRAELGCAVALGRGQWLHHHDVETAHRTGRYLEPPPGHPQLGLVRMAREGLASELPLVIQRARRGDGPTLIEARTWRQRGHWGGDAATYRHGPAPIGARDPLEIQAERLISRREADAEVLAQIREEAEAEVAEAIARARALPEAGLSELGLNEVFA